MKLILTQELLRGDPKKNELSGPVSYGSITLGSATGGPGWRVPPVTKWTETQTATLPSFAKEFVMPATEIKRSPIKGAKWQFKWSHVASMN